MHGHINLDDLEQGLSPDQDKSSAVYLLQEEHQVHGATLRNQCVIRLTALREAIQHLGGAIHVCCIRLWPYGGCIVGAHFVVSYAPWPGPHVVLVYEEADGFQACGEVWANWRHDNGNCASAAHINSLQSRNACFHSETSSLLWKSK